LYSPYSFFFIVCGVFERKLICAAFLSFVYICIAVRDPVQEGRVGIPLTGIGEWVYVLRY
jgi:hypothetical protein